MDIPNLSFPVSNVRAAFIKYSVYRSTTTTNAVEAGNIQVGYNTVLGTWVLAQDRVGDASISFAISTSGQLSFSTTAYSGTGHTGVITYEARAMENA